MLGIIGIIAFPTVLCLSLFVTRLATIALTYTGLSREAARFQARSAFTGTGFTTSEAEKVVDHPVRRQIITLLMIARSAGLVTIIISLILSFAGAESDVGRSLRLLWIIAGLALLLAASRSRAVDRLLKHMIDWALRRWTALDTHDYASLLNLSSGYAVTEIRVRDGDWLTGKKLQSCNLPDEGVTVLGIYRKDGDYVAIPRGDTDIYSDDTLILYGRKKSLQELEQRRADQTGEKAHRLAVSEQKRHAAHQQEQERKQKRKREPQNYRHSSNAPITTGSDSEPGQTRS